MDFSLLPSQKGVEIVAMHIVAYDDVANVSNTTNGAFVIALQSIDSFVCLVTILMSIFTFCSVFVVLLHRHDTFNKLGCSRIFILLCVFLLQTAMIFGLDQFWSLWGRLNGNIFNPVVTEAFCTAFTMTSYGVAQPFLTATVVSLMSLHVELFQKASYLNNMVILFFALVAASLFVLFQGVIMLLNYLLGPLGQAGGFDFLYSVYDSGVCTLPLLSYVGILVLFILFLGLFHFFSWRMRQRVMNNRSILEIYRIQFLITITVVLSLIVRIVQVLMNVKLLNFSPAFVPIVLYVNHLLAVVGMLLDEIFAYIVVMAFVLYPIFDGRRSSGYRKKKLGILFDNDEDLHNFLKHGPVALQATTRESSSEQLLSSSTVPILVHDGNSKQNLVVGNHIPDPFEGSINNEAALIALNNGNNNKRTSSHSKVKSGGNNKSSMDETNPLMQHRINDAIGGGTNALS